MPVDVRRSKPNYWTTCGLPEEILTEIRQPALTEEAADKPTEVKNFAVASRGHRWRLCGARRMINGGPRRDGLAKEAFEGQKAGAEGEKK